jgi:phosphonate transport system ATP-binding protein
MHDTTAGSEAGASSPASGPWPIRLTDVTVRYPNGVMGLRGVSLAIEPGEMVSVVGLSGSGKSTLIRTINSLVPVTSGTVQVGPYTVNELGGRRLRQVRGSIGMIFQGFNLADRASIYHNVLVGRFSHTPTWKTLLGLASRQDRDIVMSALDSVGMLEKVWGRAGALSGGQKQRVAIARALTQEPQVMLADEPVASLDPPTAHAVMSDLRRINTDRGLTVLVNLHVMDLARQYTTRMIGLRAGEVVYDGPAGSATDADFEAIYGRPIQTRDVVGQ